jgi:hypothetical protein
MENSRRIPLEAMDMLREAGRAKAREGHMGRGAQKDGEGSEKQVDKALSGCTSTFAFAESRRTSH